MKIKEIVAFTYELTPEKNGFSVKCLDWDCVYTQGETIDECKKNAAEVTTIYLKDLIKGTLHPDDFPKIKNHKATIYRFVLNFDLTTGKPYHINNTTVFKNIKAVKQLVTA